MSDNVFITTSWDDGHPADMRLAEMLARHGLTGTFYIPRSIETGTVTTEQLLELAGRFEIGAHTLNHVFLADADDATARDEIAGSKKWIEDVTGRACPMFCPPAGRYRHHHLAMFRDAGFAGIRTVEFLSLDHPRSDMKNLLELPTTLQAFPQSLWSYARNLAKRMAVSNLALYALHGRSRDWVTLSRRLAERAVRRGGVFHLWGHSWELERHGLWSQLEEVLAMLGGLKGQAACVTNGELCRRVTSSATLSSPVSSGPATRAAVL